MIPTFIVKYFYYGKFQAHVKIEIIVQQNFMNPLDNTKHFNSGPILFCLCSHLLLPLLPGSENVFHLELFNIYL